MELFWEQPSVIVAIAGALLVAAYCYISNALCAANLEYEVTRTFIVLFAMVMSFTSVITAVKHRFFSGIYLEEIRKIEVKLDLEPIQMWTKNAVHPRGFNRLWEKWSADKWLIFSLIVLVLGLLFLAPWNIYDVILRII